MSAPLLVGYDGTERGDAALDEALRLAGPLGAEVVLAFAIHYNPGGGEVLDLAKALEEHAREVLETGTARALAAGVQVRSQIVRGRPRDALPELATVDGAQMIILGSLSHRLVANAMVPVLVAPQ